MLKEIYEQPEAVRETIGDRARRGKLVLEGIGLNELEIQNLRRIVIVACGTAYHAGVVGRYIIEEWARVPVEPDIASEWRYRNPVLSKDTLVIGITQSGETADTIAAMRLAREHGARTLAITNQLGTQITREVDAVLHTSRSRGRRCGDEDVHRAGRPPLAHRAEARADPAHAPGRRDRVHPRGALRPARQDGALPGRRPSHRGDRAAPLQQAVLPLPRATHRLARRARRRAQAEGDLLHPDRGLLRRGNEARPDRLARLRDPGRLHRHRPEGRLRQGRLEHPGGAGRAAPR